MNLPIRRIQVTPANLSALQEDVYSSRFVDGVLIRDGVAEQVQLGYRGNRTRDMPKKSFEVRHSAGTLHLNAEYDDPCLMRNALSFRFFQWIGVLSPAAQHCRLFLNEEDLGVYLEIEGVDRWYFRRRGLSCTSLFYAVNHDANFGLFVADARRFKASLFDGYERIIGNDDDQKRFERFIFDLNTLRGKRLYRRVHQQLDVPMYLRWLAGAVCTGNADGFTQNYAVYESARDRRYRFMPWDYEGSWGRNCYGKRCPVDAVGAFGENVLSTTLLSFPSVRRTYQRLLRDMVNTVFTEERVLPVVMEWMHILGPALRADASRSRAAEPIANEIALIRQYIRERRKYLLDAMVHAPLLTGASQRNSSDNARTFSNT